MTDPRLFDEELVVHVFAPLDGAHVAQAYGQVRNLLENCRDQLGMTQPLRPPDLGRALPVELPAQPPPPGNGALAALEDRASDFQLIVRREHDILNFSMVFAAPLDTEERRLRIGSAVPNGWLEFDRWWQQLATGPSTALLGTVLINQAKLHSADDHNAGPPPAPLVVPHPGDDFYWRRTPPLDRSGFLVWETSPADDRADRRLVVLAPTGEDATVEDAKLSAWTWSDGRSRMPPLCRYLMHAAKLRYHSRVLGDGTQLASLRQRIEKRLDQLTDSLAAPHPEDVIDSASVRKLRADEAGVAAAQSDLAKMKLSVQIAIDNMRRSLDEPLPADHELADWLPERIADEAEYLAAVHRQAQQLRTLLPAPDQREPAGRTESPIAAQTQHPRVEPRRDAGPSEDPQVRLLFAVDVEKYSVRSAPEQKAVQERLAKIADSVLETIGITMADVDRQGTGDGMNVVLPASLSLTTALPKLLTAWHTHLSNDNRIFRDRMRLRLSLADGLFGHGQIGFTGGTIIEVSRLLDSDPLRSALTENPEADLVALISDHLYDLVVRPRYEGTERFRFSELQIKVKNYEGRAWLWVPT